MRAMERLLSGSLSIEEVSLRISTSRPGVGIYRLDMRRKEPDGHGRGGW